MPILSMRLSAPADPRDAGVFAGSAPASLEDPSGESDVLDAQALDRLRELDPTGEGKLMERVVKAFDVSLARLMPQLSEALGTGELGGIRHVAHTLKSSSASIGAMKLSRMCSDIEARARNGQPDGMDERVAQLQAEVVRVQASLNRILGTP